MTVYVWQIYTNLELRIKKIALIGTLRRKGTNQNLIVQDVDLFRALLGFSFCCQHLDLILLVLEQLLELFALLLE